MRDLASPAAILCGYWCAPVNSSGVTALGDQLWGKILWGATQCVRFLTGRHLLGKAKVCHLDIAFHVNQQVLRLQIPARSMSRKRRAAADTFCCLHSLHSDTALRSPSELPLKSAAAKGNDI